jgi:hypothetical protein
MFRMKFVGGQGVYSTTPLFHPVSPIPMDIKTEADGLFYAHQALILPLLTLLSSMWPQFDTRVPCEVHLTADLEIIGSTQEVQGRLGLMILGRRKEIGDEWKPVLMYQAKTPGTLCRDEWDVEDGSGDCVMIGNAIPLCQQGRKYLLGADHTRLIICDMVALLGIRIPEGDISCCGTHLTIQLYMFWQESPQHFLRDLLSVAWDAFNSMDES